MYNLSQFSLARWLLCFAALIFSMPLLHAENNTVEEALLLTEEEINVRKSELEKGLEVLTGQLASTENKEEKATLEGKIAFIKDTLCILSGKENEADMEKQKAEEKLREGIPLYDPIYDPLKHKAWAMRYFFLEQLSILGQGLVNKEQ